VGKLNQHWSWLLSSSCGQLMVMFECAVMQLHTQAQF
jgi:hypothetical protein